MLPSMRIQLGPGELRLTLRTGVRRAMAMVREDRAMIRAARSLPKPVPWEWAKPRLLPLLAGPMIDGEGASPVRLVVDLGPTVIFGLNLHSAFPIVDEAVAQRWECTPEQIHETAMANLRRWASGLAPSIVRSATMSGHRIRVIQKLPAWASSLVLSSPDLRRLFGGHDQVFAAPSRDTLLSFSLTTPERLLGDIVVDFEMAAAHPLLLDPFLMEAGALIWGGEDWDPDDGADVD